MERKTFDFNEKKVEIITLDELKKTYQEVDTFGRPLRGLYHYQVIEEIYDILQKQNLKLKINEIFAAKNGGVTPGVVKNPDIEKIHGENSIESHVLRRIYANLQILDFDNDELTTNAVIAFHQDNIQLAYGPMVRACHNQCILSPTRVFTTDRKKSIFEIITDFANTVVNIRQHIEQDKETINKMKLYPLNANQILQIIGIFTTMRVQHDTLKAGIRTNKMYPLNNNQINTFTEDLLLLQQKNNEITLWDLYNIATNLYKGNKMSISNIIPQHLALNNYINTLIE